MRKYEFAKDLEVKLRDYPCLYRSTEEAKVLFPKPKGWSTLSYRAHETRRRNRAVYTRMVDVAAVGMMVWLQIDILRGSMTQWDKERTMLSKNQVALLKYVDQRIESTINREKFLLSLVNEHVKVFKRLLDIDFELKYFIEMKLSMFPNTVYEWFAICNSLLKQAK